MSLLNPGNLQGLTPRVIAAVAATAAKDHAPRVCQCAQPEPDMTLDPKRCARCLDSIGSDPHGCDIPADEMPITDILPATADRPFDRISFAYHRGEKLTIDETVWEIGRYVGRWRLTNAATGEETVYPESVLAQMLDRANGPHPNPFVAIVEVQYATRGNAAGYGIRRDGTAELFYN